MRKFLIFVLLFCLSLAFQGQEKSSSEPIVLNPEEIKKMVSTSATEVSGENAEAVIRGFIIKIQETQDPSEQRSIVQDLYDDCLSFGLNPSPDTAEIFLAMAIQAKQKGDLEGFSRYLDYGLMFDQKNPAIHQALATVTLENKGLLSFEYFFQAFAGWLYSFTNFESRYVALANLALWIRTFSFLLLAVISIILFIRYNSLVRHDVEERLQIDDEKLKKTAGYLLLFLPCVILLSGYWLVVYWAAIFLIYARWQEKIITIFSVLLFLVSGALSLNLQHELFLSMYPPHFSNVRCYSNRIDIGPDMILTSHTDPNDPLSDTYTFVLANRYLLHRSYVQAEKLYTELLKRKPDDPYIMNNLGCLYFYQQRIAEAINEWSKAIDAKPNLAVAYLNRSLGKNKQFDFDGAKEDQDKCRSLDPVLYQQFTETQVDELIPLPYYPSLESTKNMAVEQFKHFNKSLQGPLKPTQSRIALLYRPAFSIGTIVFFGAALFVLMTKKREKFARSCYKCGRAYCSQCKTSLEFESFCGQCVHLYIKQDGVSPQARMQKNYEVEVFNKKGKIIRAVLALLSPGAGHIWEGHISSGFVILILWLVFLSGFVSRIFAYPMPYASVGGTSHSAYNFIAILFMVVLWFLFGLAKALSRQTANLSLLRR